MMKDSPLFTLEQIRQYEQLPWRDRFPLDTIRALLQRAAQRFGAAHRPDAQTLLVLAQHTRGN